MLNRNIDGIIYESYVKLGEIAYQISKNMKVGNDNTRKQKELISRGIYVYSYLTTIGEHIEVVNNSVYQLRDITEVEMNKLLVCLSEAAEITDLPIAPGVLRYPKKRIATSTVPGPAGQNGVSAYVAVVYAEDASGTNISVTPDVSRPYIAIKTSTSPIPINASAFTGLWRLYIGTTGATGSGGADGQNVYPYVRYASDALGSNFSTTPDISRKYIAILLSTTDLGASPISSTFNGLWVKYLGDDGAPGIDGNDGRTILSGDGSPSDLVGQDGDFYIDTTNWIVFGPKNGGAWPSGVSIVGPTGATGSAGANGSAGADGASSYLYIAWADDALGTGFTMTFTPNKNYIALLQSNTLITPVVGDFSGFWTKYQGDGDRWSTTSTTPLTIGTGIKNLLVETGLAYSAGQRVVIAENNNEDNRMEGYCRSYEPTTGQLYVDIDNVVGSGTINVWDVNLFGVPVQIITVDSYFGEIYVTGGASAQTLSTTPTKLTAFAADGAVSVGITLNNSDDSITVDVRGTYFIVADLNITGDTGNTYFFELRKNGTLIPGTKSKVTLDHASQNVHLAIQSVQELNAADVITVYVYSGSGTPNVTVEEGRLSLHTTGSPSTPDFSTFENLDVDLAAPEVVDSFLASLAVGCEWDVVIRKSTNYQKVKVSAVWESTNINYDQIILVELGTIDLTLSVDINAGNVRLVGTTTSDNWIVSGNRTLIK